MNRATRQTLPAARAATQSAARTETSFRIQLAATAAALLFLVVVEAGGIWWALVSLTIAAVLSAELFNTALERLVDRLHPERHPEIKLAKDCAAGAVLVLSFASLGVFAAFLWDRFGR